MHERFRIEAETGRQFAANFTSGQNAVDMLVAEKAGVAVFGKKREDRATINRLDHPINHVNLFGRGNANIGMEILRRLAS